MSYHYTITVQKCVFLPLEFNQPNMDKDKIIKVVHLEINGEHYYYGSITALCENWNSEQIGVNYRTLRDMRINTVGFYQNSKCTIRIGKLEVSSARKKTKKDTE